VARRDTFVDHLGDVPLFRACSRKARSTVARRAKERSVGAGEVVINEGETGNEFFVIMDGQAQVRRGGKKVATLGPGQFFGDLAVLDKAPRNATVTAETPMALLVLGQREFSALIEEVPGFAHKLLAGLAHRLREADAKSVQ
jgi:CRP/FNR family transcriptional regulator, cyclic AMP receptor protein